MVEQETLADYIARLCRERGLSWRAASLRAGLNPNYITQLVRGHRPNPKAESLRALAEALEGDYEYMLRLRNLAPPPLASTREQRLITALRWLPPDDQERIIAMINGLVAHRRKQADISDESPT